MNRSILLTIDGIINLVLGLLLIAFPTPLVEALGIPNAPGFYPNILGGVFIGITIALIIESYRKGSETTSGLGLTGAISINLCGGLVLLIWLIAGTLNLPPRGIIFLWILDLALLIISSFELWQHLRLKRNG